MDKWWDLVILAGAAALALYVVRRLQSEPRAIRGDSAWLHAYGAADAAFGALDPGTAHSAALAWQALEARRLADAGRAPIAYAGTID
jgi:hypothetical protein